MKPEIGQLFEIVLSQLQAAGADTQAAADLQRQVLEWETRIAEAEQRILKSLERENELETRLRNMRKPVTDDRSDADVLRDGLSADSKGD